MKIQFLGATGTVTGSKYLLTHGKTKVLVDCGLFQGFKNFRLKNWSLFPVDVADLDAVVLTHAHIDHSGYIPVLVKEGFRGKIFCTEPTFDLCKILLPDSGYLQEEEAKYANKHGYSKHKPALALYTLEDAKESLKYFSSIPWKQSFEICKKGTQNKVYFQFFPAGHLLGAASVLAKTESHSITFSGDIGRKNDPMIKNPDYQIGSEDLVVESTYGNRLHSDSNPEVELGEAILKTYNRGGITLIPSFAVGRAQTILYYLKRLLDKNVLPYNLPIYLNSPMAYEANKAYDENVHELKISAAELKEIWKIVRIIKSTEESIALVQKNDPAVIVAASGMATGGRVLHHLKTLAPNPRNLLLFAGFQAGGTRGDLIVRGAKEIKIHGQEWPIRAEVMNLTTMSGHADSDEILAWVKGFQQMPKRIFITHGEPDAANALKQRIEAQLKILALVPEYEDEFELN